jgi:hypothetical protein
VSLGTGPDGGQNPVVASVLAALFEDAARGLIVELGPRSGELGRAIQAAGFEYVGVALGPTDRQALQQAGLRTADATPDDPTSLSAALAGLGEVRGFMLAGALGWLPEPEGVLRTLAAYCLAHAGPPLIVAEPNAGNHVTAVRLLAGQAASPTDAPSASSPSRTWTSVDLLAMLRRHGWRLAARHDVTLSNRAMDPAGSLLLAPTLAGDLVRHVGRLFNPDADIGQFVWRLESSTLPVADAAPANAVDGGRPLVSILMRTQGRRNDLMIEALYSIFAQTCDAYEVLICFHDPDGSGHERRLGVERVIASLPPALQERLRLLDCANPGRGAPLNTMLARACGAYVSILDDDDLLFDHHVETIRLGIAEHGAHVLFQTYAAQRLLAAAPGAGGSGAGADDPSSSPYGVVAMSLPWARPIEAIEQHHANMVPICCLALPLDLVRQTRLRFRNDLEVAEEWAFWMEALQLLRVVTLPEVTAAVNHWNDASTNAMLRPELGPLWRQIRDTRHAQAAPTPLLLDGTARVGLAQAAREREELAALRTELAARDARLRGIQTSRAWRVARALWWLSERARGMKGRLRG